MLQKLTFDLRHPAHHWTEMYDNLCLFSALTQQQAPVVHSKEQAPFSVHSSAPVVAGSSGRPADRNTGRADCSARLQ